MVSSHSLSLSRFLIFLSEQIFCAGLYFLIAKLGLQLATINANASPVWPATGLAISLVFLRGYKVTPAIWIGAFLANWGTGLSLPYIAVIASGNALEAFTAIFLLHRIGPYLKHRSLYHSRVFLYVILSAVPTFLSASFGTLSLMGSGAVSFENAWMNFVTWWIGDGLGFFLVFPLVHEITPMLKIRFSGDLKPSFSAEKLLKGFIAILALILSSYFVFGTTAGNPFLFVIFFAFLGIILWFPFWAVYIAALLVSGYSIWMTNQEVGPFKSGEINESLLHLEFFLASVWLTVVVLSNLKQAGSLKRAAWTFSIGWLLTGATFFAFYENALHQATATFDAKTHEATLVVHNTMESYIRLLEAGASFMNSSELVTAQDWNDFTTGLRFSERYPGLKGLGVVYPVDASHAKEFERKHRREQFEFTIREVKDADRSHLKGFSQKYIITLIAPKETNLPALGLDIASEKMRFKAAISARDNNEARLTGDIRLQQSLGAGPGYLLLLPFYHRDADLKSVAGRRAGFRGFVYAPLEGATFFKYATAGFQKDLELLRFETIEEKSKEGRVASDLRETTMNLAGITFRLLWKNRSPKQLEGSLAASLAGFCGAFFTLALALIVAGLEGLGMEAQKMADQMTAEVRERERRWRALTEASPVGICLTDADSRFTYVNQRWIALTGLTLDHLQAGKLLEIIHPEDETRVKIEWERFLSGETAAFVCDYRIKVQNKWRYVSSHSVEMKSEQGERLGFLGTMQDLTDLHNNQVALATASRLSSLGQMAGGIAHEINTPLAVIATKADLMKILLQKSSVDKDKIVEQLRKIQETVHRIAKIVRGLKSIAREPSAEQPIVFAVKKSVIDTLDLCQERFQHAGIDLRLNDRLDDICEVQGYPEQITQVLLNLLNNSFDAVAPLSDRWVQIDCFSDKDSARVEISDSGSPLPSQIRENLFNPFFTTKKTGEGTGLGLSLSKAIIEKCGGRLYFDGNRPNTTFVMELPITRSLEIGAYDAKT